MIPFTKLCPPTPYHTSLTPNQTVNPEHLKTRLELNERLKMDIMNLMEKGAKKTPQKIPSPEFFLFVFVTAGARSRPPVWRHRYSMADSTQQDGILMGIKSKAAPVTVALSQPVCQPLCTRNRVCV